MQGYWISFTDGSKGYCEGTNAGDAMKRAQEITGKVAQDNPPTLPYPAIPTIWKSTDCPPFCYSPEQCKGRTACPKNYACSE
jgi:hypothetical protein